jgi:hypothetical protein
MIPIASPNFVLVDRAFALANGGIEDNAVVVACGELVGTDAAIPFW